MPASWVRVPHLRDLPDAARRDGLPADVVARLGRLATAAGHFGRPLTTVVNNALAAFSFNGDARPKADAIGWDAFQSQFEGSVRGALNTVQAALPAMRAQRFGRA